MVRKKIFEFEHLKDFLRDYLDNLPKKGWGEIQRWADYLGIHSSFISQVLSGAKSFNTDQAFRLSQILGLHEVELEYFMTLVDRDRVAHHQTKKYYTERLQSLKKQSSKLEKRVPKDKILNDVEKSIFYSSWMYSAVRLLTSFPEGQTAAELCAKLNVQQDELFKILKFLCETGLCVHKKSRYFAGLSKTHIEKDSPHVRRHWLNWHVKAIQRFDNIKDDELVYSAPFSISEKDLQQLKEALVSFIQQFLKQVENSKPEHAAVLNIDLIKLL